MSNLHGTDKGVWAPGRERIRRVKYRYPNTQSSERQREGLRDRQTDRQTERQREGMRDRQTDKQRDRERE